LEYGSAQQCWGQIRSFVEVQYRKIAMVFFGALFRSARPKADKSACGGLSAFGWPSVAGKILEI
jgi:hypothetical protein